MDHHELIKAMREAFSRHMSSHHILDIRSRELDYYLKEYIERLDEVLSEMEETK